MENTELVKQHSFQIIDNGEVFVVSTILSLDDLDLNGVANCQPVKQLDGQENKIFRLGTYMNIAEICKENGRMVDEIAALRRVEREFSSQFKDVATRIESIKELVATMPKMPAGWSIVAYNQEPENFRILANIKGDVYSDFWHPGAKLGGLLGTIGLAVVDKQRGIDNLSFHVCKNERVLATIPTVVDATHTLAWVTNHPSSGPMPIEVHFIDKNVDRNTVYKMVYLHLNHLLRNFGAKNFIIMEHPENQFILYRYLVKKAKYYSAEIWDRPYVDLSYNEKTLFSKVRKSFKSNINWCTRNMVTDYFTGTMITDQMMRYFYEVIQDLHKELLEKNTDGMTYDLFMHPILMCRNGMGEVAITRTYDDIPYGITVTTYDGGIAYYALGGSRKLNGRDVGHFIVFDSLIRAKSNGMSKYILNRFFSASISLKNMNSNILEERAINLTFYKRGYSGDCEFINVYNVFI